jgi:hypothetical protein
MKGEEELSLPDMAPFPMLNTCPMIESSIGSAAADARARPGIYPLGRHRQHCSFIVPNVQIITAE